ncbi:LysR family transcriptional regulator [Pandoraea captiosa]|uniref:LysR family transcriptional regulator n=1 Tax=Pandoraea captiosa TaxID=2508302 RepID=A0A5E4ZV81_9BURK|nr:LysR family transcriptional regulator [Pandoraea captiosa]VVE65301.1 LysR family transcriptional regulator [Pandoraea captiosa]
MSRIDLNLLTALDALLSERSVTGAAQRLNVSVSAMSRTLARLRVATGDRLLLQAGRSLVLTPYAQALSERVPALTRDVTAALGRAEYRFDAATLEQRFTLRAGEGFLDVLGAALLSRIRRSAPSVQLRFIPKADWSTQPLRDGTIDLEIGVVKASAPEVRTRVLFRDRYVGVCAKGHPVLRKRRLSVEHWAAYDHIMVSRSGDAENPVDVSLAASGVERKLPIVVPSYSSAVQLVRHSELLAVIPRSCLGNVFVPDPLGAHGVQWFELPVAVPEFTISAIWHPRLDHDPAQRWFRAEVLDLCRSAYPEDRTAALRRS